MSESATEFDPSMIGRVVEIKVIHSQQTGVNYYDTKFEQVGTSVYAGRLAEYTARTWKFEPVGNESPTTGFAPRGDSRTWPDHEYRMEIRVAAEHLSASAEEGHA